MVVDRRWIETVPVFADFARAADPSAYARLPDCWCIGISDVINSTGAIDAGRYRDVNLVAAGCISAVSNALSGELSLFAFGGDGARFAVSPEHAQIAADALSRTATWARRELKLDLRVGMTTVAEIRAAGFDVRAAFLKPTEHVQYAMFSGGGLEWADAQLKRGEIGLPPAAPEDEPDLTGLSCQWGPVASRQGAILSLIVKPLPGAPQEHFAEVVTLVIETLEQSDRINPVPADGPEVHWPSAALGSQSRIASRGRPRWLRRVRAFATAAIAWLIFTLGLRVGRFDPGRYRREIATNSDFRKFDDGLFMTVDCSLESAERVRAILEDEASRGLFRYGLHLQDEALMTCVAPSIVTSDHLHFIDGSGGGYAEAARRLKAHRHTVAVANADDGSNAIVTC